MRKQYFFIILAVLAIIILYIFSSRIIPSEPENELERSIPTTSKVKELGQKAIQKKDINTNRNDSSKTKEISLRESSSRAPEMQKANASGDQHSDAEGLTELMISSSDPSAMFKLMREKRFSVDESTRQELLDCWKEINKRTDDQMLNERLKALLVGFVLTQTEEALPLAEELFNDQSVDTKTRMYALQAIATLGGTPQLEFALQHLSEDDPTLKTRAIEALGLIGDEDAIPELERIISEEQLTYRRAANVSLIQIEANSKHGSEKVEYIHRQLGANSSNVPLVLWGVHTLWAMKTPEAISVLESMADAGTNENEFLNTFSSKALNSR